MDIRDLTVLVAEDHDFQRRLAVGTLQRMGAAVVIEAADGAEALAALRDKGGIDVVLCDLDMPGMDGVEFIRRVAEERLAPALVIVSGLEAAIVDSVERMSRAHGHLVLGTVEKPITAQKLQNVLENIGRRATKVVEPQWDFTPEEMLQAVADGQIEPWMQPKVLMANQHVAGAEALARWRHPEAGIVPPHVFLHDELPPNVVDVISWAMIDGALRTRGEWASLDMPVTVSVNVGLRFLEDLTVADRFADRARELGIAPDEVIIEVTEGQAATKFVNVMENLTRLRIKGFGISIDDYGTGYSSIQQLARIPYTELKLDNSFVIGAAHKPNQRAILESALDLARRMKLTSVAEGIEREEEWQLLKSLGCDQAQGFYIAPPMPPEEFPGWYLDWMGSLAPKR